jgi:uncharacterized protein (DUF488 family)
LSAIAEILTVGHSTHQSDEFLELLRGARIEALVDVRRFPGSRRMPWFNEGRLRRSLTEAGIEYLHLAELGGRRGPAGLQGYADHMTSDEFAAGLERLEAVARRRATAVMCAEAQWRRCHRRLLADALAAGGWTVVHVGPRGEHEPHAYPAPQVSLDV